MCCDDVLICHYGSGKDLKKQNEHIYVYVSKFEGYRRFFKGTLLEEAIIDLFLYKFGKLKSECCGHKAHKTFLGEFSEIDNPLGK